MATNLNLELAPATESQLPSAVLWDMDGTLIDTEPYWLEAEASLAREHGVDWTTDDGLALIGGSLEFTGEYLRQRGVALAGSQIAEQLIASVRDRVSKDGVPWQPGALTLLRNLKAAGVRNALVTMSYRSLTQRVVAEVPELFEVVICGDEVERGKPDPMPYLMAAERLGVPIEQCLAVEDSVPGVASACSSGATPVAVQLNIPVSPRPGLSRVASLNELSLEAIAAIHSGQVLDTIPG